MSTERWRLETRDDIDGGTYRAWTDEPTDAVRKASDVLFAADTTDAVCFGWVPQAYAALDVALDVEEMAGAMFDSRYPAGFPGTGHTWATLPRGMGMHVRYVRMASAARVSILGAES